MNCVDSNFVHRSFSGRDLDLNLATSEPSLPLHTERLLRHSTWPSKSPQKDFFGTSVIDTLGGAV